MDKETYREVIRRQRRKGKTSLCCSICGEDNPIVIESHHIMGRGNSDEVIPLCKNCHAKITSEQNLVSPRKRKGLGFNLVTIGALLKVIADLLTKCGHEMTENG